MRSPLVILLLVLLAGLAPAKPALFIIGDSTVKNSTAGQRGWGDPLAAHFDGTRIDVRNLAIGGRSSRTFLTEGRWDAVMAGLKAGDFVLMQFGHNDGGPLNAERARASLKGSGDETEDIIRVSDGEPETVLTYGAYLRRYVADAKARGATPIVLSQIPRNIWRDEKIGRAENDYGRWAREAAEQAHGLFIDFNALLADRYESLGPEKTATLFTKADHTHTNSAGAEFNAAALAEAIRNLDSPLRDHLLPTGLWLPSVFSDHLVLQRDMAVPVWGRAAAGETVTVTLAGASVAAKADASGEWKVKLPPMPAGGPFVLGIASGNERREIKDVMIGEVWLCSGQSNMDFTMAPTAKRYFAGVTDWEKETAAADHPRIRSFTAEWTMHEAPQRDVDGRWQICASDTAGDLSAVAYYFARQLEKHLEVPVGLVVSAYGGSKIESWISEAKLSAHPQFTRLLDDYKKKRLHFRDTPSLLEDYAKAHAAWTARREALLAEEKPVPRAPKHPDPVQDPHHPAVLHNGMIAPVAGYAIRGAIWYQGESNVGTRDRYADLQKALIGDWRDLWENPQLPFYFVQLAPHKAPKAEPADSSLAQMREAQAKSLEIPHTGMAVTLDIGEEKDVHPRNKLDVGKRLARLALAGTYDKPVVSSGPVFDSVTIEGSRLRVHFKGSPDLVAKDGPLRHFALAGADGKFAWADAVIDGETVVVSCEEVANPVFVRYAWADNPVGANLFNSEGLPAAPFRNHP